MTRPRGAYVCQACGYTTPKWLGRCPECGGWNTLAEEVHQEPEATQGRLRPTGASPVPLTALASHAKERRRTGLSEFDRVLGGGFVAGSVVLVAGDPGVGKSTLLLQTAGRLASEGARVLYVSGEESPEQIHLRASRLGVLKEGVLLLGEVNVEAVLEHMEVLRPELCIVDSIQTLYTSSMGSAPGSVGQVREVASRLIASAKRLGVPLVLVGHVTKDGAVAGPRVLEHMVDAVLAFEGESSRAYRVLRATKNRFGSTNEIGIFEMASEGLVEVQNPSAALLAQRPTEKPGSVVVAVMEGSRPLLLELQALVSPSSWSVPRRMTTGLDANRLILLAAILEKRAGFGLHDQDIYLNVAGGVRVEEPAADLAAACAIVSSFRSHPVAADVVCIGEVGLAGEVRAVPRLEARCQEASALGFRRALIPPRARGKKTSLGLEAWEVASLEEAFQALFEAS